MMTKKKSPRLATKIKNEIAAIVGTGCSLATAAKYAGCALPDIRRELKLDADFRSELTKAGEVAEIYFLRQIKKAAQKEQYWRAAAWALERKLPGRYAARNAGTLTTTEIREIFEKLAEIVLAEVPQKEDRKKIIARVEKLLADISRGKALPENHSARSRTKKSSSPTQSNDTTDFDGEENDADDDVGGQ